MHDGSGDAPVESIHSAAASAHISHAVIATYAERERISFAAALRAAAAGQDIPLLNPRSRNAISGFVAMLDELHQAVERGDEVGDILDQVLDVTGYRAELEASDDPQDASRLDNLTELITWHPASDVAKPYPPRNASSTVLDPTSKPEHTQ